MKGMVMSMQVEVSRQWVAWSGVALVCFFVAAPVTEAQLTNHSSVMNGMGNGSSVALTGGTLTNLSSGAQPGGITVSTNSGIVNYAGFLGGFSAKPMQDTDGDGLDDEVDPDNDNDGLTDGTELAGDAFDPTTSSDPNAYDTDGDGVLDGAEALAGSDPTNENVHLQLVNISPTSGREISWQSRTGKVYRVLYSEGEHAGAPTNILMVTTGAPPGSGLWAISTNTVTDLTATNQRSFAVQLVP